MPSNPIEEFSSPQDLLAGADDEKGGGQLQELQEAIQRELDARKEERLIWILIVTILFDVYIFSSMNSMMGPLVIGIFELLAFILLARMLGMDAVISLIDKMMATARGVTGNGDKNK